MLCEKPQQRLRVGEDKNKGKINNSTQHGKQMERDRHVHQKC